MRNVYKEAAEATANTYLNKKKGQEIPNKTLKKKKKNHKDKTKHNPKK